MRLVNFRLITQKYIEHSWAFLFLTHLCYTFLINIVKQRMKFFGLFCRRTLHLDGRRSNSRLSIILSFLFWFINGAIYQLVSLLSANNTAPFCYTCIHLYSFHTATDFSKLRQFFLFIFNTETRNDQFLAFHFIDECYSVQREWCIFEDNFDFFLQNFPPVHCCWRYERNLINKELL